MPCRPGGRAGQATCTRRPTIWPWTAWQTWDPQHRGPQAGSRPRRRVEEGELPRLAGAGRATRRQMATVLTAPGARRSRPRCQPGPAGGRRQQTAGPLSRWSKSCRRGPPAASSPQHWQGRWPSPLAPPQVSSCRRCTGGLSPRQSCARVVRLSAGGHSWPSARRRCAASTRTRQSTSAPARASTRASGRGHRAATESGGSWGRWSRCPVGRGRTGPEVATAPATTSLWLRWGWETPQCDLSQHRPVARRACGTERTARWGRATPRPPRPAWACGGLPHHRPLSLRWIITPMPSVDLQWRVRNWQERPLSALPACSVPPTGTHAPLRSRLVHWAALTLTLLAPAPAPAVAAAITAAVTAATAPPGANPAHRVATTTTRPLRPAATKAVPGPAPATHGDTAVAPLPGPRRPLWSSIPRQRATRAAPRSAPSRSPVTWQLRFDWWTNRHMDHSVGRPSCRRCGHRPPMRLRAPICGRMRISWLWRVSVSGSEDRQPWRPGSANGRSSKRRQR